MSTAHNVSEAPIGRGAGSGDVAAAALVRWFGLAAAPTFAIMALWTALFRGPPDMVCMAMRGSLTLSGMTLMYLLMSGFHSSPRLRLIVSRRNRAPRHARPRSPIEAHSMCSKQRDRPGLRRNRRLFCR